MNIQKPLASLALFALFTSFSAQAGDLQKGGLLAIQYLKTALAHPAVQKDHALKALMEKTQQGFSRHLQGLLNKGPECDSGLAFVVPEEAKALRDTHEMKIHFCEGLFRHSDETIAQTLIHEVSHFMADSNEHQATRLEMLTVFYGGGYPSWAGWMDVWEFDFEKYAKQSSAEQKKNGYDFLPVLGIKTAKTYEEWRWNYGMSGDIRIEDVTTAVGQHQEKLGITELSVLMNHRDTLGMTPLMFAAREGASEVVAFLITLPWIDQTATDSKGRTAKMIAIEYGNGEIAAKL